MINGFHVISELKVFYFKIPPEYRWSLMGFKLLDTVGLIAINTSMHLLLVEQLVIFEIKQKRQLARAGFNLSASDRIADEKF